MDLEAPWGRYQPRGWGRFWLRVVRGLPTGRLWSRWALLTRRIARLGMSGPVDTSLWGFRLRLAARRGVSEGRILFLPQFWDVDERDGLADVVREGTTFVDVGANVGGYTFWAASRVGPAGRVVAVEATPDLADQLRFNVDQNGADGYIVVCAVAVADREGETELVLHEHNPGENRLASVAGPPGKGRVTVPAQTLAGILERAGVGAVDVMKIDVEGAERTVLDPYFRTVPFGAWPRFLMVEAKKDRPDLIDWLEEKGYALIRRTRLNGILRKVGA